MSNSLTGLTVSSTYGRLVQVVGGLYYDGFGNLLNLGGGTFSIGPQGATGPKGETGSAGLDWAGIWDDSTLYFPPDIVSYDGAVFLSIQPTGSSGPTSPPYQTPDQNTQLWTLLIPRGSTGPQGLTGATGPQGEPGPLVPWSQILLVGNTASTNVDINQFGLQNTGFIDFDITPSGTNQPARLLWNAAYDTLELGVNANFNQLLGQQEVVKVVNKSNTNLLAASYSVMKVRTAQGQRLAVDFALGTSDLLSADTLGIVCEDILNNQEGVILTKGELRGINTTGNLQGETWNDGDLLFLSPTVPGGITKTLPIAPNHTVRLGYVVYAHQNNGKIYVKIDNGYELGELHDVYYVSGTPSNNDVLSWNGTQSRWEPRQITGATGPQGPQGATGVQGLTGLQGATGPSIPVFLDTVLATLTGTTTLTILNSVMIPANTVSSGNVLNINFRLFKSTAVAATTNGLYINTTLTTVGAQTAMSFAVAAATRFLGFKRDITVRGVTGPNNEVLGSTLAQFTDDAGIGTAGPITTLTIDWTQNQYIFTTSTLANATDIISGSFLRVKIDKQLP